PALAPAPSAAVAAPAAPVLSRLPFAAPADAPRAPTPEESGSWSSFWDGAEAPGRAPADLARLSAPYRTRTQLARLSARPAAAGAPVRFAVIGDAEPGRFWFSRVLYNPDRGVFWRLLARADRSGADFIVQLGDMVSRGIARNFRAFFRRLREAAPRTPYLTVAGNHDRRKPHGITDSRLYRALFGTSSYAFDRAGWRFVFLDNSDGRLTRDRLEWLDSVLKKGRPTLVFTHMPPAPLGEWTDFGAFKGSGGFREGAKAFMRLMSERGVSRVYLGHVHAFGVLERGGVRYVLTGGGGSPLYPGPVKARFHHWLEVEAGPSGLAETVRRADGTSSPLR
ncbi:MAG: metallophosphoesterase, partial [Elusimicrobia bacterium]|nr:metallophosphoesterase [Elusimicrobiota bacterium]